MSAFFPSSLATALNLLTAINNTKVLLDVNAGIGDTTITVDDASPLPTSGYLTFNDDTDNPETIKYTGKSGNDLTGVTRGADGTSAGTHTADGTTALEMRWNADYHNILALEIIAIATNISNRFGLNTNIVIPTGISVQDADGIGIGAALVTSALLSMTSTTKGFLPPRMTSTQRDAIATPATGLMIFNTTTSAYNLYNGVAWVALAALNTGGDVLISTAAKGVVVTTPDGAHTYRLAVDNNGEFTTELVS
jgi:hypothetical protein